MFKHILVPVEGSDLSKKAAKSAVRLAKALGVRVTGFFATELYYPVAPFPNRAPAGPSSEEFFEA